jgi:hypothetical protein
MFLKRHLLWIVLFGTLIGLNESLIGSFSMPYRSVILSTISLIILSIARIKIQKAGTSILIIMIAVLFKLNNMGMHACTANALLCGPTALLLMGIFYEISATLLISKTGIKYLHLPLICGITAIAAFTLFALMNTYLLNSWNTTRLFEYISVKATLTALFSSGISLMIFFVTRTFTKKNMAGFNPPVINGILGGLIILLWVYGSIVTF